VIPYQLRSADAVVDSLCQIRDPDGNPVFERTALQKQLTRARQRRFDITRLQEDVSLGLVSIIEEHAADLPGIVVQVEARREYTLGPAAFHVLGYMGEIPKRPSIRSRSRATSTET
jgi:penicillin-binding protein 2